MKKSLLTVLFILILIFTASFAANAVDEPIMGEIKVINGAGETVMTYEVVTNNPTISTESTIQKAANYCRDYAAETDIYTVIFPQGQYAVDTSINVYSNTVIDFSGSVITRLPGCGSILRFGKAADIVYGYDSYRNITIKNGTFDANQVGTSSLLRFAHASGVEISGMTFRNTLDVSHQLTFAASEKVKVYDCQFLDMVTTDALKENNCEAIQIDVLKEEYFTYPAYDGTVARDIEISGCTFSNVPRGLGTHTGITGYYFDRINIINNTFSNISGYAVKVVNYTNSEIYGNTITDCGSGICCATVPNEDLVNYFAPMSSSSAIIKNLNVKIHSNNISVTNGYDLASYGIKVHGKNIVNYKDGDGVTFSADCRISGITVENNTVSSSVSQQSVFGVYVLGAISSVGGDKSEVRVVNNKITFTNPAASSNYIYGIKIEKSENIYINANTVTDTKSGQKNMHSGIISDGSKGLTLLGNSITNAKTYGIRLSATSSSAVTGNTVSVTGSNGIYVYNNSSDISVSSNNISYCSGYGVSVYNSSVSAVTANNISNVGGYGITVRNSRAALVSSNTISSGTGKGINLNASTVTDVVSNKISSVATEGIYLISSKVENLKSNNISDTKGSGITLEASSIVTVTGNTVSRSGAKGIYLNKSSVTTLKSNTVSSAAETALYAVESTVSSLTSNKIENGGGHGIYMVNSKSDLVKSNKLYSITKYSINLKDSKVTTLSANKIYDGKKASIYLSGASKVTALLSNYVCGGNGSGIYLTDKASATEINKNKIDLVSEKADGIAVNGKAKAGKIKNNSINAKTKDESKKLKVKCRYGIRINSSSCKVSHIYKNTVKYAEKSGIYVAKMKKDVKVRVTKNTVAKAMYGISYVEGKATVKDNTVRKYTKASVRAISK